MDRVHGLTWRQVSTTDEVDKVLKEGSKNRATAATSLNAHSSRSHALLSVKVTLSPASGQPSTSTIHLVDLAGSERVDKSEVCGKECDGAHRRHAISKNASVRDVP